MRDLHVELRARTSAITCDLIDTDHARVPSTRLRTSARYTKARARTKGSGWLPDNEPHPVIRNATGWWMQRTPTRGRAEPTPHSHQVADPGRLTPERFAAGRRDRRGAGRAGVGTTTLSSVLDHAANRKAVADRPSPNIVVEIMRRVAVAKPELDRDAIRFDAGQVRPQRSQRVEVTNACCSSARGVRTR